MNGKRLFIGRYVHRESPIHRMHPFIKFSLIMLGIVVSGSVATYAGLGAVFGGIVLLGFAARLKPSELAMTARPFRFLLLFTILLQLLFGESGFSLVPDAFAVENAVMITGRFLAMILLSAILTLSTTPVELVRVLSFILRPLKYVGVDVNELSAAALIALRFIPLLFEEAERIITAQKLRGELKMESGGIRAVMSVERFIVPLFMRVLYYAEQIGITLSFRGDIGRVMRMQRPGAGEFLLLMIGIALTAGFYVVR